MRSPSSPLAAAAAATTASLVAAAALALLLLPRPAAAQSHQQPVVVRGVAQTPEGARAAAAFARAQRLVAEGQGPAGRAVVDSTIAATDSTSPVFAEGLFWRASLAATAADAERDYRTLAVEYPVSPRSADALLRLAQLEMARGDRALAVKHLERLTLEHPTSPARPRASYWMARVYFESADVPRACAALDAARSGAAPDEMALRAQIDEYSPRCKGLASASSPSAGATSVVAAPAADKAVARPAAPVGAPASTVAAVTPTGDTQTHSASGSRVVTRDTISIFAGAAIPATATTTAPASSPATATATTPSSSAPAKVVVAVAAPATRAPGTTEVPAAPFPPVAAATPSPVSPSSSPSYSSQSPAPVLPNVKVAAAPAAAPAESKAPLATATAVRVPPPAPSAASPAAATRASRELFSVQLAAFDAAAPAEAMAARLRARGLDARVSGTAAPFRVRVGRYATNGAAAKAAASFKSRGQPAWVVTESVPAAGSSVAGAPPGAAR